jgi:hypothetical protein
MKDEVPDIHRSSIYIENMFQKSHWSLMKDWNPQLGPLMSDLDDNQHTRNSWAAEEA